MFVCFFSLLELIIIHSINFVHLSSTRFLMRCVDLCVHRIRIKTRNLCKSLSIYYFTFYGLLYFVVVVVFFPRKLRKFLYPCFFFVSTIHQHNIYQIAKDRKKTRKHPNKRLERNTYARCAYVRHTHACNMYVFVFLSEWNGMSCYAGVRKLNINVWDKHTQSPDDSIFFSIYFQANIKSTDCSWNRIK